MTSSKTTPDTSMYVTYELNGIPYLPHYQKDCFVPPNYMTPEGVDLSGNRFYSPNRSVEYSAKYLESVGATKIIRELWNRSAHFAV